MKNTNIVLIILSLFFVVKSNALRAGGIDIKPESVRLNGYRSNSIFATGQDVLMTYNGVNYSFSGGGHSYQYILFKVFKKINLENSVGLNCVNNSADILIVQGELKARGYFSGKVDGNFSDFLVGAIKKYQKFIGMQSPDGRIDKFGFTMQSFKFEPIYFVQYARDFTNKSAEYKFSSKVEFDLPDIAGKYYIAYNRVAIFSDYTLGYRVNDNKIKNNYALELAIKNHVGENKDFSDIFEVEVTEKREKTANVKLFLKVNNLTPSTIIQGGINEKPINFSWSVVKEKEVDSLQFRYKISPYEDWSPWQQENYTCYSFIREGNSQLQIECKYNYFGEADTTLPVLLDLSLKKPYISSPCESIDASSDITFIDKGDVKRVTKATSSKEVVSKVYDKSTALLIGVNDYSDNSFGKLPYINNDLRRVKQSFSTLGFEINEIATSNRENIMAGIRNVLINAGKNDRIIIYITAHGFIDELGGNGYIACSDCIKNNPNSNCISIKEIGEIILSAKEKTKNILLILDSCFSGLGAIDKSNIKLGPAVIAGEKGCHIMTAGMSTQTVKMDHSLKMSVFTYFLTDGLNSRKADYTNDGIITLTELLVYVNYHVAKYTSAEQTPVFGRLSGIGEMIF